MNCAVYALINDNTRKQLVMIKSEILFCLRAVLKVIINIWGKDKKRQRQKTSQAGKIQRDFKVYYFTISH